VRVLGLPDRDTLDLLIDLAEEALVPRQTVFAFVHLREPQRAAADFRFATAPAF
jgi:hypothetical protein